MLTVCHECWPGNPTLIESDPVPDFIELTLYGQKQKVSKASANSIVKKMNRHGRTGEREAINVGSLAPVLHPHD